MGLFDHLFKPKPEATQGEQSEGAPAPEPAAANLAPPKPPAIPPPGTFGAPSLGQIVTPGRAGAPSPRGAPPGPRSRAAGSGMAAREIVLTLDDVMARIPTDLLAEGAHDGRRALRFSIDDLSADIARGRAAVPLSQIAAQCPDIFRATIDEDNDILVRLPLQKLVEQIAPGGFATTSSRGAPAEATDAKIHLSIAAILRTCPREIIVGELPPVADTDRIVFPFAPIERQLPSGRVDVSSIRFVAALPLHMHQHFRAIEGVRVPLPLDEIFQNLPGVPTPTPPAAPLPTRPSGTEPAPAPPAPEPAPAPSAMPGSPPAHISHLPTIPGPAIETPPSSIPPPAQTEVEQVPSPPKPAVQSPPAFGNLPATAGEQQMTDGQASPGPAPVAEPTPAPAHPTGAAQPSAPPKGPHTDLEREEIAELRARIAALKREFSLAAISPAAPGAASLQPVAQAEAGAAEPAPSTTPAPSESTGVTPASSTPAAGPSRPEAPPPSLHPPVPAPQPTTEPSAGSEAPPAASPGATAPDSEPAPIAPGPKPTLPLAPSPAFKGPPPGGISSPPAVSPPVSKPATAPTPEVSDPLPAPAASKRFESTAAPTPARLPERFRPPLAPPPVAPMIVTTPKIEPPAPVMLPVRIVAPPPVRPHVSPPRLFSTGENVPLAEVAPFAPEPEPEPPAPPPPLVLDRASALLGIAGEPTLARVADHLASLPGLAACVIEVRHEAAQAGLFSQGPEAAEVRGLITPLAAALAGREEEHISLFGEHGSVSVFAHGNARFAVLHRARVFLPGVREKLAATAEALAEA